MLSSLLSYFEQYGYWVVFFGVMLENAGVPVPGETTLLAAGFFAALGHFNLALPIPLAFPLRSDRSSKTPCSHAS